MKVAPPHIVIPAKSLPRTPIRGRYPVPASWIPVYVEAMGRPHFHPHMWPSQGHGDSGLELDSCEQEPSPIQSPAVAYRPGGYGQARHSFSPYMAASRRIGITWEYHVGIASGNGIVVMLMVYVLGPVSGAHINPAVIFGMAHRGRLPRRSRRDRGLGPRRPVWQANRPCTRDTRRDPKQG